MDNEIPLGRRTLGYRCFEVLPAAITIGSLAVLGVLAAIRPVWAAWYLLAVVAYLFVKSARLAVHSIRGWRAMRAATAVDWSARLRDLERAQRGGVAAAAATAGAMGEPEHRGYVRRVAASPSAYPVVAELHNAVIVPAYNEPYEVIAATLRSLDGTTFPSERLLVVFTYEERGGAGIARTAARLEAEFGDRFGAFLAVCHPADIPGEVPGKGANITFAGRALRRMLDVRGIAYEQVIVTTLDCDNRPHPAYFDAIAYEYVVRDDRARIALQPISIFTTNIWDAPAPSRVVASSNSLWNLVSAVRPGSLRNFASHAQPMDALVAMDFWSTRTIVEDGHQFWRSWFHFGGDYRAVSVRVPIYQDVVLAGGFWKTMRAQFNQLRRWAYGASDVPFVAVRVLGGGRRVPFGGGMLKLFQLVEGHVTLGAAAVLVAVGPWVPWLVNGFDRDLPWLVRQLPFVVGVVQQVSMSLLVVTIAISLAILPSRPARVPAWRHATMVAQWLLVPVTALAFSASSSIVSQVQLAAGRYREVFVVTEKSAVEPTTAAIAVPARTPQVASRV